MADIRTIEKIIEANLERPEQVSESIEETAQRIAETLVLLHTTMHDTSNEEYQEKRIQDQVLRTKELEIRDAKNLLVEMKHLTLSVAVKENLWKKGRTVLENLENEKELLQQIEYILSDKKHEKIEQLKPLIKKLIIRIQENRRDLKDEERLAA